MVFERQQPGQLKAGALALLVHALFLGLMIFGVSWQNREPAAVEAELWGSLPVAAKPVPIPPESSPAPKPKPEPKPKLTKPEPLPEAKAVKADIDLKAKEEEKRKKDESKKEELKQKKEERKQEEEKQKKEQDEKRKQEKQDEVQRRQQAQAAAANAQKTQLAAQQAAAGQSVLDDFSGRIQSKIKRFINLPPDLTGNPQAEFDVVLMPTGELLDVKLARSSGSSAYDKAVERAIYKAAPLPLPPDPALFSKFRQLHLKFRLNED